MERWDLQKSYILGEQPLPPKNNLLVLRFLRLAKLALASGSLLKDMEHRKALVLSASSPFLKILRKMVAFEKTQGGESTSDLENCSIPYEDWYGDVGPDDWYYEYVTTAYEKGWLTYDEDHPNFNPNELINRAEVAKLLVKARGEEYLTYFMTPSFANIFEDILEKTEDNKWFYGYAYLCKKLGIFDGYSSGEFCPHKPIVRAEVAKVISTGSVRVRQHFQPSVLGSEFSPKDNERKSL